MDEMLAFLRACVDEDEAAAGGCMNCGLPIRLGATKTGWTHGDATAVRGGWQGVRCPGKITGALPWPDPDRELREVAFKRAILAKHAPVPMRYIEASSCRECRVPWPCPAVHALLAVYRDCPGLQGEVGHPAAQAPQAE